MRIFAILLLLVSLLSCSNKQKMLDEIDNLEGRIASEPHLSVTLAIRCGELLYYFPEEKEVRKKLALYLLKSGYTAPALRYSKGLFELNPENRNYYQLYFRTLIQCGSYKQAENLLQAEKVNYLSDSLFFQDSIELLAKTNLQKELTLLSSQDINTYEFLTRRAIIYFGAGESGAAYYDLKKALKIDSSHIDHIRLYAQSAIDMGYFVESAKYKPLLKLSLNENDILLYSILEKLEIISSAIKEKPAFGAFLDRAKILLKIRKPELALKDLDAAQALKSDKLGEVFKLKSIVYLLKGDKAKSRSFLQKAKNEGEIINSELEKAVIQ